MEENQSAKNIRIAKNTFFLYLRMFLMMGISLYTSRIVLSTLGEVDYGLYNVVGGIVTMFTFVNFAMTCATNRYLSFELGKNNIENVNKVFSTSIIIHVVIAIFIFLLGETIGLWFLNTQMTIPADRMVAANWIYQLSILSCMVMIVSVPYNAIIISYEKMGAYAYISILEVILKLVIVWMLLISDTVDRLILYGVLMLCVNFVTRITYQVYCNRKIRFIRFRYIIEKDIIKDMSVYAFWSLCGSAANVFAIQGQNILLNMFFGPVVNAARGVAVQVQNAIQNFSTNFQNAMNPQINKSYAVGDLDYMFSLINASSKYSYYLLYIISLPVVLEINVLLKWWLVEVPEHTTQFIQLMLAISIVTALGNPISNVAGAYGRIRNFQLIVGGIMLLVLPVSYVFLKLGYQPESIFIVQLVISLISQIVRLVMIKQMINFSLNKYFNEVVLPCLFVTSLSCLLPIVVKSHLPETTLSFWIVCVLSVFSSVICVYGIGLKKRERDFVNKKVCDLFVLLRR